MGGKERGRAKEVGGKGGEGKKGRRRMFKEKEKEEIDIGSLK